MRNNDFIEGKKRRSQKSSAANIDSRLDSASKNIKAIEKSINAIETSVSLLNALDTIQQANTGFQIRLLDLNAEVQMFIDASKRFSTEEPSCSDEDGERFVIDRARFLLEAATGLVEVNFWLERGAGVRPNETTLPSSVDIVGDLDAQTSQFIAVIVHEVNRIKAECLQSIIDKIGDGTALSVERRNQVTRMVAALGNVQLSLEQVNTALRNATRATEIFLGHRG